MKAHLVVSLFAICLSITCVQAQENPVPQRGSGGWQGPGGGRGGFGGMGMGRGTVGTVTEATADHFAVKTELGELYTVFFSVNTRILKQPPGAVQRGQRDRSSEDAERTPPQAIKATEIKVGDVIAASGEADDHAKSVGAVFIMLIALA